MRIEIADRKGQDHEVNGREMGSRTGTEEVVHILSGQACRRRLPSRSRKHSCFTDRTSNLSMGQWTLYRHSSFYRHPTFSLKHPPVSRSPWLVRGHQPAP